jgi:hypothetical protein
MPKTKHAGARTKSKKKNAAMRGVRSFAPPTPDPAYERWFYEVSTLAFVCSVEVQGVDVDAQQRDLFFVHRAGEEIWATSRGAPSWGALDVDAFFTRLAADYAGSSATKDDAFATLLSFFTWLERSGRLSPAAATIVLEALDGHVTPIFREMGYVPVRERMEKQRAISPSLSRMPAASGKMFH